MVTISSPAIAKFRYIKIQTKTVDVRTRLRGIYPTNSVVIPGSLVLKSIVLGRVLVYRNWSISRALLTIERLSMTLRQTAKIKLLRPDCTYDKILYTNYIGLI